ncbi:MAG: epoxide hydrolase family protein [Pseudomonadota bacterium]
MTDETVREFVIAIDDGALDDLRQRLGATRWPDAETPEDWSQGTPLAYMRELTDYWANDYDWRQREALLNRFPQFKTRIDGLDIHFIHARSSHEDAVPLLMTHGWPGSIVEFQKVIAPLTEPTAHGGSAAQAFHVVCPSLPGYGFSDKPAATGCGVETIAGMWHELMRRLGYARFVAQGGDWGSAVTTAIGLQDRGGCAAIHVNMPSAPPTQQARENPTERDKKALAGAQYYQQWDAGYSKQQSTRPQTLGYGLVDSPAGQAAWIIEKFWAWCDCDGHPENALTRDELLDNVMLYWLPGTGASSARLYWESFGKAFGGGDTKKIAVPTGCSIFPEEIVATPRAWTEQRYGNIQYWNELDKGGHFAAFEQPELFVNELRSCFHGGLGYSL